MKDSALWQISITTSREAEEAVAALLEKLFEHAPSVYTPEASRKPLVTVYASKARRGGVRAWRTALGQGLQEIAQVGLDIRPAKITVTRVARQDWAESWKKYFKPIEIGNALLIRPSWSQRRPRKRQAVVILDPGLSFGTGQHPTTSFCLEHLVTFRQRGCRQSFLDIGTGSGILAIAAAKLGYEPVKAFDVDPVAVRVAKANAKRNRLLQRVSITRHDLSRLPRRGSRPYDLICANLIATVLLQESGRILNRLRPGGRLVLAGILSREFSEVRRAYEAAGLKLVANKIQGEWQSGAFERKVQKSQFHSA
ncbi:MAG: 50S ribosomal protein L11 methyltransferase [Verrucomicrobia bacterium]|nr:50S ribosomal protein L11 methyltransferase [Verrucomicrobiota bacterium]